MASVTGIGEVADLAKDVIGRIWPDKSAQEQAELSAALLVVQGQLAVNQAEAASSSVFVAGWRPFVGWCCGLGFLWATIAQPMVTWVAVAHGWPPPPAIDTEVLLYVLGGMLGLGTLRSFEKTKGVA